MFALSTNMATGYMRLLRCVIRVAMFLSDGGTKASLLGKQFTAGNC